MLAAWYKVVGISLESERTFGLIQHLAIIFGLFVLARPWGRIAAAAVAGLGRVLRADADRPHGDGMERRHRPVPVEHRVRAARPHGANPRRSLIAAGVLAGLALTYRPDLALALILVYGWYLWRNPRWKTVVLAAVVGLLPMWVHIALVGPSTAFRGMVIDPVFKLRAGRELPRPPSWTHLDGSLQAIAELVPPWWKLPALSAQKSLFLWFFAMLIVPVILMWVAVRLWRQSRSPRAAVLLCGALFSVGIAPQALQRPDSTHLSWVTCISFPFLILAVVELVRDRHPRSTQRQRVAAGLAVALGLTFVVAPLFTFRYYLLHTRVSLGNVQTPFPVSRDGRRFYLGDFGPYLASRDVIADLDRVVEARRTSAGRPERSASHLVQRRILLLHVPRADSVDVLHRDGSRVGQRARVATGVGGCIVGLGDHDRVLGWLARAEQLDGLRIGRAKPGAEEGLLRGQELPGWTGASCSIGAPHEPRAAGAVVSSAAHRDPGRCNVVGARCRQRRQASLACRRPARSLSR